MTEFSTTVPNVTVVGACRALIAEDFRPGFCELVTVAKGMSLLMGLRL